MMGLGDLVDIRFGLKIKRKSDTLSQRNIVSIQNSYSGVVFDKIHFRPTNYFQILSDTFVDFRSRICVNHLIFFIIINI